MSYRSVSQIPHNDQPVAHPYPEKPAPKTRPIPKIYRITLNSANRIFGTVDNATFSVKLPVSMKSSKVMLFPEFFAYNDEADSSLTDLDRYFYHVRLRELMQPNTFFSGTNSSTDIIFTNKGRTYATFPTLDTLGFPLENKKIFESSTVNIYITSPSLNSTILSSRDWTLVLTFYEYPE